MKKFGFTFLILLLILESTAQIKVSAELGFMRSVSRYDASGDPQKSMSPYPANSFFESMHVTNELGNHFNVGLHLMRQKQDAWVKYNQNYFEEQKLTAPFYTGSMMGNPSREFANVDPYFMLGPEINGQIRIGQRFHLEAGLSFLFYDNRQVSQNFDNNLNNQESGKNHYYDMWHNQIYIYRHDTEFLNGWNMKVNGAFRVWVMPFKSRSHTLSLGVSAGRSLKQNYAVNFRTNKPNSETETNVVRVQNYGEYYGINLGYGYRFELNRE